MRYFLYLLDNRERLKNCLCYSFFKFKDLDLDLIVRAIIKTNS